MTSTVVSIGAENDDDNDSYFDTADDSNVTNNKDGANIDIDDSITDKIGLSAIIVADAICGNNQNKISTPNKNWRNKNKNKNFSNIQANSNSPSNNKCANDTNNNNDNNTNNTSKSGNENKANKDEGGGDFPRSNGCEKQNSNSYGNSNGFTIHFPEKLHFAELFLKYAVRAKYQPLNSWVLELHYRVTCFLFLAIFLAVCYNWYWKESIYCISGFNSDNTPEKFLLNICLSYSYTQDDLFGSERRYILFYRWVHYAVCIVGPLFYIPRLIMKHKGNPRFKSLLSDLHNNASKYKGKDHDNSGTVITSYFEENLGTHASLYYLFLFNHALCTVISFFVLYFLDFMLQGSFRSLHRTLPITRDLETFRDLLSRLFPPFVTCSVAKPVSMQNERDETFYCHFTLMEFYEKAFVFLYFYLITLILLGCMAVIGLFLLLAFCPFHKYLLKTELSSPEIRESQRYLIRKLAFSDVFCLYIIKGEVSEKVFCYILMEVKELMESRHNDRLIRVV